MDEMNNVTMENETSMMENAPVENLVPAEAEGYTSDCGCESNANLDLGKIVKIGVGAALLIGAGVKYGIPAAKKGFKHIKEKMASLGTDCYVPGNEALNDFINGDERSVMLHFNCDGPIIDKI